MTFPGLADDRSVFIYYGDRPNSTDCATGANSRSAADLMTPTDLRFDTSRLAGGTFYDTAAARPRPRAPRREGPRSVTRARPFLF